MRAMLLSSILLTALAAFAKAPIPADSFMRAGTVQEHLEVSIVDADSHPNYAFTVTVELRHRSPAGTPNVDVERVMIAVFRQTKLSKPTDAVPNPQWEDDPPRPIADEVIGTVAAGQTRTVKKQFTLPDKPENKDQRWRVVVFKDAANNEQYDPAGDTDGVDGTSEGTMDPIVPPPPGGGGGEPHSQKFVYTIPWSQAGGSTSGVANFTASGPEGWAVTISPTSQGFCQPTKTIDVVVSWIQPTGTSGGTISWNGTPTFDPPSPPNPVAAPDLVAAVPRTNQWGTIDVCSVVVNEVHGHGQAVGLQGDYIEIWNRAPKPLNLAGWGVGLWVGDAGPLIVKTLPAGPADVWVKANGFYVLQEGGVLGDPLSDPLLAGVAGMRIGPTPFLPYSSIGIILSEPQGVVMDYVYLRRGVDPPPSSLPHDPGVTYVLGNVGPTGGAFGHLKRMQDVDYDTFADWTQDPTTRFGTPGAPNTTDGAQQTDLGGAVFENTDTCAFGQADSAEASLSINGVAGTTFPKFAVLTTGDPATFTFGGAPGAAFLLFASEACNAGHVSVGLDRFDLGASNAGFTDVIAFAPSPMFLPGAFTGPTGYLDASGSLSITFSSLPRTTTPLALQVAVFSATSPIGVRLSSANVLRVLSPGVVFGPVAGGQIPDGGGPLSVSLTTPAGIVVRNVDVVLDLAHPDAASLHATLAFNGELVELFDGPFNLTCSLAGTYKLSDAGFLTWKQGMTNAGSGVAAPGAYKPLSTSKAFFYADSGAGGGVWTLSIYDHKAGGVGALNAFSLILNADG